MSSPYRLIFQVSFQHAFFADGVLRSLHVLPTAACRDLLRRAGVMLSVREDGLAVFGDDAATERLRLHVAEAGAPLDMDFQLFPGDPHFFEYTVPAWPRQGVLLLSTAFSTPDAAGRRMLHATPFVTADAFVARDQVGVDAIAGKQGPAPAIILRVAVSSALLDAADIRGRQFHACFDAASSRWKYCLFGAGEFPVDVVDLAGEIEFEHFSGIEIGDRRCADVFLSKRDIPMREVSAARFQLRATSASGEKVLIKRMPNASVGKRFRDSRDGNEILVSEIFINH